MKNLNKFFGLGLVFFVAGASMSLHSSSEVNSEANEVVDSLPEALFSQTDYDVAFKRIWKSSSAKKMQRSVAAQDGMSEAQALSLMSPSFKTLKARIVSLKTTKELQALLDELESQLAKGSIKDADTQFFAAQFVLIRPLRAFTWKMIPVVDDTRVSHSAILTGLRNVSSHWNVMFPNSQWTVGLRYVTEPFDTTDQQFVGEDDLHKHIRLNVYSSLRKAYIRVRSINVENAIWDNQLLYGRLDTFKDDHYRFRKLSSADQQIVLSQLSAGMAHVKQFAAYNTHGLLQINENVGRVFGMDGFAYRDLEGATDERIASEVKKARNKHPRLLTLKTLDRDQVDGAKMMSEAYVLWESSYRHLLLAWNEVKAGRADADRLINPAVFQGHHESIDAGLSNVEAMLYGSRPIVSKATGETVTIDLKRFYSNPPQDLYALLPYKFESTKMRCPSNATPNNGRSRGPACGSMPSVRNYEWGSATHWHAAHHSSYMPDLKSDTELAQKRRIAIEASSGWFGALPLSVF